MRFGNKIDINISIYVHLSSETEISLSPLCSGVFNFRVSSACFDKTLISPVTANFIALWDFRREDELTDTVVSSFEEEWLNSDFS